jgi:hypothetical protein
MAIKDIKLVKLITGMDILGEVGKHENDEYGHLLIIRNPVSVIVMPNRTDPKTPSVGFAPFNQFSDDKEVIIDSHHVLCISNPVKEFVSQYSSMFSGLVLPDKSSIIVP